MLGFPQEVISKSQEICEKVAEQRILSQNSKDNSEYVNLQLLIYHYIE